MSVRSVCATRHKQQQGECIYCWLRLVVTVCSYLDTSTYISLSLELSTKMCAEQKVKTIYCCCVTLGTLFLKRALEGGIVRWKFHITNSSTHVCAKLFRAQKFPHSFSRHGKQMIDIQTWYTANLHMYVLYIYMKLVILRMARFSWHANMN